MVRYKVPNTNISDKIRVTRRDLNVESVADYMEQATNTLNQTVTLENAIKPHPVTTPNIQMNIYVTANDKIGTN